MTKFSDSILERAGLDRERARSLVADALEGADDGELYLEYAQSEGLVFDNGRLRSASFDTNQGFGLRAVALSVIVLGLLSLGRIPLIFLPEAGHGLRLISFSPCRPRRRC